MLVVRVTALDSKPTIAASTISKRLFGPEEDTVASAFSSCSFGKLRLEPPNVEGIKDGVFELSLDIPVKGVRVSSLENTMTLAMQALVGPLNQFQHVMYCMPPGTKSRHGAASWSGGYSQVGGRRSVYTDETCGIMDLLVHELSHNFGLGHAGEGSYSYGDTSGRMGTTYRSIGYPIKCFNAAMTAQLGWYDEKQVSIDLVDGAWRGKLYGITDFNSTAASVVQLRVNDLFIQYNKAVGINRDTSERENMVNIVRSTLATASITSALGGIKNVGSELIVQDFGDYNSLIMEICGSSDPSSDAPDFFDISIHLDMQPSRCNDSPVAQSSPSIEPTSHPSITSVPSISPTIQPVFRPSAIPTLSLIPSGSQLPSDIPTLVPSPSFDAIITDSEPSPAPSSCVDNDESDNFFRGGLCTTLQENPTLVTQLCQAYQPTYWLCPKTCGLCS